jgi:hypothetical protein
MSKLVIALALTSVVACESTYHPEYHPVTVTEVHQSVGSSAAVTVPAVVVVPAPALADPNIVFQRAP